MTRSTLMTRSLLAFAFGLVISGLTGLLLPTNALGAGWVFLIDVLAAGGFAGVSGWRRFRGEAVQIRERA